MGSIIPKTNHNLSVFYIKLNFITVFTHSQTFVKFSEPAYCTA